MPQAAILDAHLHKLRHCKNSWLLSYYKKFYTENTVDIPCHTETWNNYTYDIVAPPNTQHIQNKNTNSMPSNIQ